ncbi:uncharacterized protein LACBIDRAFT_307603 [Laccaria bicolor S238N-H82]|uniref:Predicted protein n=1 Tax=Laccaria bicolor (strain S238N-H82 / ATCC MYA-4686) TaxID=486041 RepID=B0DQJ4_LACBS|nr:uncharacterized protein LACBIDRAFT_307603 [Laccaria bicolor S238N-H82]EDR03045.1 predicted protein [Laccaria bicolor S238N-H82]|eukprot:XP_001886186.1 predicted protein [Laccaria bicolor S238N-H82]
MDSLDQYSISLNMLYMNCEQSTCKNDKGRSVHELVVVCDEGGMTFGVWLGEEAVRNERGRGCYGNGAVVLVEIRQRKLGSLQMDREEQLQCGIL